MKIKYNKSFLKRFKKLDKKLKVKVWQKIAVFVDNPFDETLQNHVLTGHLSGKRAIKVAGDCRIIFEEIDDYVLVVMLDVWTHNQVYE